MPIHSHRRARTCWSSLRDVEKTCRADAKFAGTPRRPRTRVSSMFATSRGCCGSRSPRSFCCSSTAASCCQLKALVLTLLSLGSVRRAGLIFQWGPLRRIGDDIDRVHCRVHPDARVLRRVRTLDGLRGVPPGRIREGMARPGGRAPTRPRRRVRPREHGSVITAAALLMAIVFGAMISSQVSFMRMFGLGLTIAVLMDATMIRMLLVPAFMRLAGGSTGGRRHRCEKAARQDRAVGIVRSGHDGASAPGPRADRRAAAGRDHRRRDGAVGGARQCRRGVGARRRHATVGVTPPAIYPHSRRQGSARPGLRSILRAVRCCARRTRSELA